MNNYDRAPSDAQIHWDWSEQILDDMPGSGSCVNDPAWRLMAAQTHATLALAARVGELAAAVRASGEGVRGELEGIRCQGLDIAVTS